MFYLLPTTLNSKVSNKYSITMCNIFQSARLYKLFTTNITKKQLPTRNSINFTILPCYEINIQNNLYEKLFIYLTRLLYNIALKKGRFVSLNLLTRRDLILTTGFFKKTHNYLYFSFFNKFFDKFFLKKKIILFTDSFFYKKYNLNISHSYNWPLRFNTIKSIDFYNKRLINNLFISKFQINNHVTRKTLTCLRVFYLFKNILIKSFRVFKKINFKQKYYYLLFKVRKLKKNTLNTKRSQLKITRFINSVNKYNRPFFKKFVIKNTLFKDSNNFKPFLTYRINRKVYKFKFKYFYRNYDALTKKLVDLKSITNLHILNTQQKYSNFKVIKEAKLPSIKVFKTDSSRLLNLYQYVLFTYNPFLLNYIFIKSDFIRASQLNRLNILVKNLSNTSFNLSNNKEHSNLTPHTTFNKVFFKKNRIYKNSSKLLPNITPWYYHSLVRTIENFTGSKVFIQIYPFLNNHVSASWKARYSTWLDRFRFYERMLGHKFFLEEALHIMHLSFFFKDSKLLSTWLKIMILRISFWRTKSIFRFLKYVMSSHFIYLFKDLKIKGLKLKLKGKVSVAGNSRKRTVLYKIGQTSNSELQLRVSLTKTTINTFTGVMGFWVWIFY